MTMDVDSVIKKRRSVRKYLDKPVPREVINKMLEAANEAPCSCNLQLMHYVVIDDPGILKSLSGKVTQKLLWAPVNIVFFVDPRFTKKRQSSIMGLGAAMQNMSLVAVENGLDTCPMAGFKGDSFLKKSLGVPDVYEAVLILAVGYAADKPRKRERIPLVEKVGFNSFGKGSTIKPEPDISEWLVDEIIDYRRRIAPVYRYGDRYSLHSYPDGVYQSAAQLLLQEVSGQFDFKICDLFSYDSLFIKELSEKGFTSILASDYLTYILDEAVSGLNGVSGKKIDNGNNIIDIKDGEIDVVTYVHKISFTNDPNKIIREAYRILKKGGKLLVTSEEIDVKKNLYHKFKKLRDSSSNVYENNVYYKIGPYKHMSSHKIDALCKEVGFVKKDSGKQTLTGGRVGHNMYYAFYEKQ